MTYNGSILTVFARHEGAPYEIESNRFIRYAYFLTAFGAGFTPILVHAAYHPGSGRTMLVDVEEIGRRRVRGLQIARKRVAGVGKTLESLNMKNWDEDWAGFCGVLHAMSEFHLAPMLAARLLTMTLTSYARRAVLLRLSKNVKSSMAKYSSYEALIKKRLQACKESYLCFTPATMDTLLGGFLYGLHVLFKHKDEFQTSVSYAIELSSSGLTRKRNLYDVARSMLHE
jgi:hypothetical protein